MREMATSSHGHVSVVTYQSIPHLNLSFTMSREDREAIKTIGMLDNTLFISQYFSM